MFTRWIGAILRANRTQKGAKPDPDERPSDEEMQAALKRLDELAKLAVFGEIGGFKPEVDDRSKSWWGGNFLGAEGEEVPVCVKSGRRMHPVLQIRVDELPEVPPQFQGLALINLWMDFQSESFWGASNGDGFVVRTYSDVESLVPIGFGYRESEERPTFPIRWQKTGSEQPSWEDMADEVPRSVATSSDSEWFFGSRYYDSVWKIRETCPIKLGGWPAWIQGSSWPDSGEYFFQVDATDKGKLHLGDSGSFYIFNTPEGWEIRGDCY